MWKSLGATNRNLPKLAGSINTYRSRGTEGELNAILIGRLFLRYNRAFATTDPFVLVPTRYSLGNRGFQLCQRLQNLFE